MPFSVKDDRPGHWKEFEKCVKREEEIGKCASEPTVLGIIYSFIYLFIYIHLFVYLFI